MAFNGSGTYNLPAGNPVVTGTTISSSTTNTTNSDIATALTNCITRDGQSTPSANLPMNAKKLTGLAAGTSAGDSVRYEQVLLLAGGTMTGAITFVAGQTFNSSLPRSTKTSAYTLVSADSGTLVEVTSGTFTLSFTAAATLGNGWFCYVKNSGTGSITLDPNASETIDGLTSYIMYPNETRLITCSGTSFFSTVLSPFNLTLTATGTFVTPPGYSNFSGFLWGGGGSGNVSATTRSGGGGGACVPFTVSSSELSSSFTVTIAAGGVGVTTATGNVGGTSSFTLANSKVVSSYGGGGGNASRGGGGGGSQGAGGSGTGGAPTINTGITNESSSNGFGGGIGAGDQSSSGYAGKFSQYGGGGGGRNNTTYGDLISGNSAFGGGGGSNTVSSGGTSYFGGDGGASSGLSGSAPAGGGAANTTGTSGAGARGEFRIQGVA
jgi:hypothetical protein